jgi:hypothetical protein
MSLFGQADHALGFDPYVTFAGNFDIGYHQTQFYAPNYDIGQGQWDTRAEIWLPPFRTDFSWGPYVRMSGIAASKPEAFENAWLGGPGAGFQVYPFNLPGLRRSRNKFNGLMGPLRVYAEYNRLNYWGPANVWRPRKQNKYGAEHWRALHVNEPFSTWWAETWNGLWWQSANEFSPTYDTCIFANAARAGLRDTHLAGWSAITPYVALQSSLTDNRTYYWENNLELGGGIRFAPALNGRLQKLMSLNRFALYAEYLRVATYYHLAAPPSTPNHEIAAGVTFSVGLWYPPAHP